MKQVTRKAESIRPLLDLASEEVLSWTDEEVRARAAEEGVDIKANADALRAAIREHAGASRLARLREARAAMEAKASYETPSSSAGLSLSQMLERLTEIVASGLMSKDSRVLLAFRSGKEIDEQDLRSLIDDYEELRARKEREEDKPE
jgi:hypothetical protein